MLFKKRSLVGGPFQCGCLTLSTSICPFLSPRVSSHPRVSGWLCSGMAQLHVCRHHRHAPTDAVPLGCLFALLIVPFSPALKHRGEGKQPAPLAGSPWALAGGRAAGAPTVGLAPHAARISCWVHNMLPFSSPAVAADGYGKRKVVGSLARLNQGSDGQKGGAGGELSVSEAGFCLNLARLK